MILTLNRVYGNCDEGVFKFTLDIRSVVSLEELNEIVSTLKQGNQLEVEIK